MDGPQTVFAVIAAGASVCGVAVGAFTMGRNGGVRKDLELLDSKVHKLANWKDGLPKELSDVFARKDMMEQRLASIQDQVAHVVQQVDRLVQRP